MGDGFYISHGANAELSPGFFQDPLVEINQAFQDWPFLGLIFLSMNRSSLEEEESYGAPFHPLMSTTHTTISGGDADHQRENHADE